MITQTHTVGRKTFPIWTIFIPISHDRCIRRIITSEPRHVPISEVRFVRIGPATYHCVEEAFMTNILSVIAGSLVSILQKQPPSALVSMKAET